MEIVKSAILLNVDLKRFSRFSITKLTNMKTKLSTSIFPLILMLFMALKSYGAIDSDSSKSSSIEFVELKAVLSSRIIHFKWDVEWENNGDYFIIEKSIDSGENWAQVAKVKSIENHKERHTYEISEINLAEEALEVFRISRMDRNGEIEPLDFVDISHPILNNLKLIPDPKKVNKLVTISWESMIESKGFISIYDEQGELIFYDNLTLTDGYNRLDLSLKSFDPGKYLIVVKNEFEDGITKKLVVY